ncbi:MAG: ABC transporter substrate-binding protein [Acidobacteriota bacterium]|nr:MAG: ABC transporter substrate-binding protein [Acidobacteriota bacterium]
MNSEVIIPSRPSRIISLVPSQTELLFDLGLDAEVIGVTDYCVHPTEKVHRKRRVGGTKKYRLDVIRELQPDLIVGNKEENERESLLQLAESHSVWISDVRTLGDALAMIRQVGELVGREDPAHRIAGEIEAAFSELLPLARPLRVGYFIWHEPYMVVGEDTFIHEMLSCCGFANGFAGIDRGRYPKVTLEQIRAARLEAIFLSSEPFPFRDEHRRALAAELPELDVYLVDGEMFSWFGSRLRLAVVYFQRLQREIQPPRGGSTSHDRV